MSLDMGMLIAGAKLQGEFEDRLIQALCRRRDANLPPNRFVSFLGVSFRRPPPSPPEKNPSTATVSLKCHLFHKTQAFPSCRLSRRRRAARLLRPEHVRP